MLVFKQIFFHPNTLGKHALVMSCFRSYRLRTSEYEFDKNGTAPARWAAEQHGASLPLCSCCLAVSLCSKMKHLSFHTVKEQQPPPCCVLTHTKRPRIRHILHGNEPPVSGWAAVAVPHWWEQIHVDMCDPGIMSLVHLSIPALAGCSFETWAWLIFWGY